jgi:hypothetical protein
MCQNLFRILILDKDPGPVTWQMKTPNSEFKRDPGPQHVGIYLFGTGTVDQYVEEMQKCTPTKIKITCAFFAGLPRVKTILAHFAVEPLFLR